MEIETIHGGKEKIILTRTKRTFSDLIMIRDMSNSTKRKTAYI